MRSPDFPLPSAPDRRPGGLGRYGGLLIGQTPATTTPSPFFSPPKKNLRQADEILDLQDPAGTEAGFDVIVVEDGHGRLDAFGDSRGWSRPRSKIAC